MRDFPILNARESVPWDAVEPHREQAKRNHEQSLEQLAERGGLTWKELYFALNDSPLLRVKNEDVDYRRLVMEIVEGMP